jgi:hypothetical protein
MQPGNAVSGFQPGGLVLPHQAIFESRQVKRKRAHWPVAVFLISIAVPWVFYFGTLRMSVYRIVLLLMFLPCLVMWISGKAGRIRIADIAVLLYSLWATLSLSVLHGFEPSLRTSGIIIVETVGAYMLARCYVRDADDLYNVVRLLFRIVVCLLPFAVYELLTGQNISRQLFQLVLPTYEVPPHMMLESRAGLTRVMAVFDHPILFGTFTGSAFALVYLVLGYRKNFLHRLFMTTIVGLTSIMSLSSGPLSGLTAQAILLCWNGLLHAMKFRWKLLILLVVFIVVAIELAANQSALDILVSYFLFDGGSYWYRKLIWQYGVESVSNHLLFGTGLGEWARPEWMGRSIDNFWLFHAVTYGLPAAVFMMLAFFSIFLPVSFKKGLDVKLTAYRTAFLLAMTGLFLISWSVALWDSAYVVSIFLMGSGVWMLDVKPKSRSDLGAERV